MKWKVLFYFLLLTFIASIYDAFTLPDHLAIESSMFTGIVLLVADLLNVFGAFCVAYGKRPVTDVWFWGASLALFVAANVYIQLQAFIQFRIGYTVDEMIVHSIIFLVVLTISSLPMVKLIDEAYKRGNKQTA
ncbi:hypothetical protein [Pseudoalteromonas piscicida]|uniref:hypothetical protein n=1 Tax=Pseudoalteromonas piscicida TaxID=43662 RepID=UPI0027E44916|nr:hypothetical protein [Pseudoalteromonas piscicida]WMO14745.1 hypothetical protein NI376_03730 [Pseudoalteromonas piscicida]